MLVYNVIVCKQAIGMRIEGYSIQCKIFKNRVDALDYAYSMYILQEHNDNDSSTSDICDLVNGTFKSSDNSYDWCNYSIRVEPVEMNMESERVICEFELEDESL